MTDQSTEEIESRSDRARATLGIGRRTARHLPDKVEGALEVRATGIEHAATIGSVTTMLDDVHERSRTVSTRTDKTVAEADTQEDGVTDLQELVYELRGSEDKRE